jgi:hypothetical protein
VVLAESGEREGEKMHWKRLADGIQRLRARVDLLLSRLAAIAMCRHHKGVRR